MSPILPPEIMDLIIDNVSYSDKPLYDCALACRSWTRRSRYHTFHTVYLSTEVSSNDRFLLFPELICHPLCTFRSSIRRFSFEGARHNHTRIRHDPRLFFSSGTLTLLPNLREVVFIELSFKALTNEEWSRVTSLPPFGSQSRLRSLTLTSCRLVDYSDMCHMVAQCQCLETLIVHDLWVSNRVDWDHPDMQETLKDFEPPPGLTTLELYNITELMAPESVRFLHTFGGALTSLILGFEEHEAHRRDAQDGFCNAIDFSFLRNLRTLEFASPLVLSHYVQHAVACIPNLLCVVTSEIRTIGIRLDLVPDANLAMLPWDGIIQALQQAQYCRLKRLVLLCSLAVNGLWRRSCTAWLTAYILRDVRWPRDVDIVCRFLCVDGGPESVTRLSKKDSDV